MFEGTPEQYEALAIKEDRKRKTEALYYTIKEITKIHNYYYDELKGVFNRILMDKKEK